jgi:V8-like Glu-specific endopeptidase
MKERDKMSRPNRRISPFLADRIFLGVLAYVYVGYLIGFGNFLYTSVLAPSIVEHAVDTNSNATVSYWTASSMRNAVDADQEDSSTSDFTQQNINASKGALQQGQPPSDESVDYPLSTVGRVFFTNEYGQNMSCSGTAITSANHSVVDTAGHCLYWDGGWVQNWTFCPLYENGNMTYGCWAARDLEVPADWINARPNDFHHDMGMAIVAANDHGLVTDVVGGAGWAYNQPANQPFYAYGYPAGYPFDGQTRRSCDEGSSGKIWQHGGGTVISIPCNMTGGSSGGPWFIKIGDNWYLNGHNDFISSLQPGHMFSPYYDDTWYSLYEKAQQA